MLIYPAIDLLGGKCVRLSQGRFDQVTTYGDPAAQLADFAAARASWVHVVDLDGAREGKPVQHDALRQLARAADVSIQCGGGVRQWGHVQSLLDAGVSRVVIGSAAVQRPDEVREWIASFGVERICCAFDVRDSGGAFEVAVHGWTAGAGCTIEQALAFYPPGSLKHVLVTDVSRDGILSGPNVQLIEAIIRARPDLELQASGGVSNLRDLDALRSAGAAGAIVGRALYEKKVSLEDALAL